MRDKYLYRLLLETGWSETRLENMLYAMLTTDEEFKVKFLSNVFKTKFNYEEAIVKKEVSRRSTGNGRTDIEVIDGEDHYVLELKIGPSYPTIEQIQKYETIPEVKEVATLTNVKISKQIERYKNTTWAEVVKMIPQKLVYRESRQFIHDFGPIGNRPDIEGVPVYDAFSGRQDTYINIISDKGDTFGSGWSGVRLLREKGLYTMPSPLEGKSKGYIDLTGVDYMAFRYKAKNTAKGYTKFEVYKITESRIQSMDEINKEVGSEVIVFNKPHYVVKLELVRETEFKFGLKNGMTRMYIDSEYALDEKYKSYKEMKDAFQKSK